MSSRSNRRLGGISNLEMKRSPAKKLKTGLEDPAPQTISIDEARNFIIDLKRPIADIAQNINLNLQVIRDKIVKLHKLHKHNPELDSLNEDLSIPVIDLERVPLFAPATVCTSPKCVEIPLKIGPFSKMNYTTRCHERCYLNDVTPELINNSALLNCWAMGGTKKCCKCRCNYKRHMHIYYECKEIQSSIENSAIQDLISQKGSHKVLIAQTLKTLGERSSQLMKEKEFIMKSIARFIVFLESNAIKAYYDSFQDYLELLIILQRMKQSNADEGAGATNQNVIGGFEEMLVSYKEEKKTLHKVLSENNPGARKQQLTMFSPGSMKKLEQDLYGLKLNGQKLKELCEANRNGRNQLASTSTQAMNQ